MNWQNEKTQAQPLMQEGWKRKYTTIYKNMPFVTLSNRET